MSNDELMKLINELNDKLDDKTKGYINTLKDSTDLKEFQLSNEESLSDLINKSKEMCGIYYFEIKFNDYIPEDNTKSKFIYDEWKNEREHIPLIIRKNIDDRVKCNCWIPFYVGKCEKVYGRLNEHLVGKSTTSSLRLNEIKSNIFKNANYKIKTLDLEAFKGNNYWVVNKIEENIREKLKPICGR